MASLAAQGYHRIDARGAAGRQPRSEERDQPEQDRNTDVGERVERVDGEQQRLDYAAKRQRGEQPEHEPERDQPGRLRQDESQHIARLRAEGETDAELGRALVHGIRHHAVEADGGQHECQRGEGSKQAEIKPALRSGGIEQLRDRLN